MTTRAPKLSGTPSREGHLPNKIEKLRAEIEDLRRSQESVIAMVLQQKDFLERVVRGLSGAADWTVPDPPPQNRGGRPVGRTNN